MLSPQKLAFQVKGQADGETFERVIISVYTRLAQTWGRATVVDGGAHWGYHTFRLAALPSVVKVYAVEASPQMTKNLTGVRDRDPNAAKVQLVGAALQSDPAALTVTFSISTTHPGRSGINPVLRKAPGTEFAEPITVAATTIDRVVALATAPVKFIKLDLEGGEFGAVRGATACLRRDRPVVVFENGFNSPQMNGYTLEEMFAFWAGLDYALYTAHVEPMTAETFQDYWYAWAFPKEQEAELTALAREAVAPEL